MPPGAIRFPFGICRVCKDKATGVHYGVASCEGCKGFFKRTITRGDNYKCFFGGNCSLEPKNRNRCKSCRFRLCLETGMSVEAVRMGRIPKEEKEKALEIYQQNGSDYSKMEVLIQPSDSSPEREDNEGNVSGKAKAYLGKTFSKHVFKLKETSEIVTKSKDPCSKIEKNSESKLQSEMAEDVPNLHHSDASNNSKDLPTTSMDSLVQDSELSTSLNREPSSDNFLQQDSYETEQVDDVKPDVADMMNVQAQLSSSLQQQQHQTVSQHQQEHQNGSRNLPALDDMPQHQKQLCVPQHQSFPSQQLHDESVSQHQQHSSVSQNQQHPSVSQYQQQNLNMCLNVFSQQKQCYGMSRPQQQYADVFTYHKQHPMLPQQKHPNISQNQQHLNESSNQQQLHLNVSLNQQQLYEQQHQYVSQHQQKQTSPVSNIYKSPSKSSDILQPTYPMEEPRIQAQQQYNRTSFYDSNTTLPANMDQNYITRGIWCGQGGTKRPFSSTMHSDGGFFSDEFDKNYASGSSTTLQSFYKQGSCDAYEKINACYRDTSRRKELSRDCFSSSNLEKTSAYNLKSPTMPQCESQSGYLVPHRQAVTQGQHNLADEFILDITDDVSSQPAGEPGFSDLQILSGTGQCSTEPFTVNTNNVSMPDRPNSTCSSASNRSSSQMGKHAGLILKVFMDHAVESGSGSIVLDRLKQSLLKSSSNEKAATSVIKLIKEMVSKQSGSSQGSVEDLPDMLPTCSSDSAYSITRFIKDVHSFSQQHDYVDCSLDDIDSANSSNELQDILDKLDKTAANSFDTVNEELNAKNMMDKDDDNLLQRSEYYSPGRTPKLNNKYMKTETQQFEVTSTHSISSASEMDIQLSLESMELASNILHRLKPEHRLKLKLYKRGQISLQVMTDSEEDIKRVYSKIFESIPQLNERILGFTSNVRGFSELLKHDREVLLKRAFYDIWMLISAEYFYDGESHILLTTGEVYSSAAMRKILNDKIVDTFMSFSEMFNAMKLTDLEITIFCAIQLTSTENVTLEDSTTVQKLHSHLLDVFNFELKRNHKDHSNLLISIFKLLPLLNEINKLQVEIISAFTLNRFHASKGVSRKKRVKKVTAAEV